MLSFTELAKHYADHYEPPVSRAPATIHKVTAYGMLQKTLTLYQSVMEDRGWMTSEVIGKRALTDTWSANNVLKRLLKAELVELDSTQKNAKGRPIYLWRWKE